MRRSFVRLVVGSVLACWAAGLLVLVLFGRSQTWTDTRAQGDGVFLFHALLDETPAEQRPGRLAELQQHTAIPLSLLERTEVERRLGRRIEPGEAIPLRVSPTEEWYFLAFADADGALAAGPIHPAYPRGAKPIGLVLAIIGIPAIAGLIVLRVERELTKVERASEALAVGELSARVDNSSGPSNELATKFNAMAERVEELVRSRDELVQAVSHELGSPLSRLRFHLELLGTVPEAERESRCAGMARELDALDELVAELLTYVQSDDLRLEPRTFDPQRGLRDLAELAELETPDDRDITVEVKMPDTFEVFADQRLFLRAIENILRNAMRYANANVRLEVAHRDRHAWVTVHDDGPGIPVDLRQRVTVPFVRLDSDRGRKTGGVGLGLAIVSRIVRRHDGQIEIGESPLGGAKVSTGWPLPS